MKKNIHLKSYDTVHKCISCNSEYKSVSISPQQLRIESCSNCNPFYTGTSASEVKVGAVEKFRQRVQKTKKKEKT